MFKELLKEKNGFSLIELLVVIAMVALLSGGVLLGLNNAKPRFKARNFKRQSDLEMIANAVYQYAFDHDGVLPAGIGTSAGEICKTAASSCSGLVDLSALTASAKYMVSLPEDPNMSSANGTGYSVLKTADGRINVSATHAEDGQTISVTR